jgi:hypothetical protein
LLWRGVEGSGRRRGRGHRPARSGLRRPADAAGWSHRGRGSPGDSVHGPRRRTLGETEGGAFRRVHAPLARGALLTAALLVGVDVLKELPATLILRPFDFDTLAVLADNYAADERLAQAAWPALLIVVLAIGPVLLLSRRIAASRPGAPGA